MGIVPIWGFQMAVAIGLAFLFRLNKALVLIGANISIPPMIPFIIYGGIQLGSTLLGEPPISFDDDISLEFAKSHFQAYILGSVTLACLASIFFGVLTFVSLKVFKKKP